MILYNRLSGSLIFNGISTAILMSKEVSSYVSDLQETRDKVVLSYFEVLTQHYMQGLRKSK